MKGSQDRTEGHRKCIGGRALRGNPICFQVKPCNGQVSEPDILVKPEGEMGKLSKQYKTEATMLNLWQSILLC